jgi:hypothetical protein
VIGSWEGLGHSIEDFSITRFSGCCDRRVYRLSLRSRGYEVFLDRDDLPAGESYDRQIESAINDSDIFLFLISADSVEGGRYTLTELTLARRKWPNPDGHVLPVMARKIPLDQVPPYLKAVTILEPVGNITAETTAAVDRLRRSTKRSTSVLFATNNHALAGAIGLFLGFVMVWWVRPDTSGGAVFLVFATALVCFVAASILRILSTYLMSRSTSRTDGTSL